jgi:hypothetical protein
MSGRVRASAVWLSFSLSHAAPFAALPSPAIAQSVSGTILGTVTDPSVGSWLGSSSSVAVCHSP